MERMTKELSELSVNSNENNSDESNNVAPSNSYVPNLKRPLVWIDLEMTGLDVGKDRILEIACVITDGKLFEMVEGPDLIINQPEECLTNMGEWCQEHHTASGLVEEVRQSQVTEKEAEQKVLEFVKKHTGHVQPLLAGNSVYMDFMFLRKYMPNLAEAFSHVVVDVSSIRALCCRWYPKDAEKAPVKKKSHRALEDIKESIIELKYMKQTIFKGQRR
uniref:Exonuclease domain-containing protein n=1 Tax=Araucaria cunninghamii TaxID=56994 RepID=A0A0D6R4J7_ARACU